VSGWLSYVPPERGSTAPPVTGPRPWWGLERPWLWPRGRKLLTLLPQIWRGRHAVSGRGLSLFAAPAEDRPPANPLRPSHGLAAWPARAARARRRLRCPV